MKNINKVLFINQMAGPLFRELAEDLSQHYDQSSELYTGHPDTLLQNNIVEKLNIMKAPKYNRKSLFHRLFSWMHYTLLVFFKILFVSKGTLIFIVSNPPLLGPFAWLACKLKGLPYVVLVYDLHPDTLICFGFLKERSIVVKIWRFFNKLLLEGADAVFTIGDVMAKRLGQQFDSSKNRIPHVVVIPPWADTRNIKPISKAENPLAKELGQEDSITVLYSGNMGISHDIDSMLQAAKLLKGHSNIKFLFIGEGQKWQFALDFKTEHKLHGVQVLPFQCEDKLPFTMALGDISLVALDSGAEGLMIPSKMYYYMASGAAIVGISTGENELKKTIIDNKIGVSLAPGSPQVLADSILMLSKDMNKLNHYKNNARITAEQQYSREVCTKKLVKELKILLKESNAPI